MMIRVVNFIFYFIVKIVLLGICLLRFENLQAQLFSEYNFKFKNYSVNEGLAHNKVNKVDQDSKGFLWVATEGGLSRFDGATFKNFKNNPQDKTSLPTNNILDMVIDGNDKIWMAVEFGVVVFDPKSYTSRLITFDKNNIACQRITFDRKSGCIFTASRQDGIFKINTNTLLVSKTILSKELEHNVYGLSIDSKGIIWACIERHGYHKLDIKTNTATYLDYYEWPMFVMEDTLRKNYITGTWLGEFMFFDGYSLPPLQNRNVLAQFKGYSRTIYFDATYAPIITGPDVLWICSQNGLGLFDVKAKKVLSIFTYNPTFLDGISTNWITDIFISQDGSIWLSSINGLMTVNSKAISFSKFYLPELDINQYNLVSGIEDDPNEKNITWMSVNGTGYVKFDKKSASIKKIYFKNIILPYDSNYLKRWLHRIHKDSNNVLWSGSYGGFAKIKNSKVSFVDIRVDGLPIIAHDTYQDKKGDLWQMGNQLIKFNPYSGKFNNYKLDDSLVFKYKKDFFVTLVEGEHGDYYVGSNKGLFLFNEKEVSFKKIPLSMPGVDERSLNNIRFLQKEGNKLFIANFQGLHIYNLSENKLIKLLSASIENKGLVKDKKGYLWAYTTEGLYRINMKDLKYQKFDHTDGLYSFMNDPITFFEYHKEMYIGYRSLFTKFNPDLIPENKMAPIPYITDVTIRQKELSPDYYKYAELSYNNLDISFAFTALEYQAAEKLNFSYILEGYDKSWSEYNSLRTKSYTNLAPGTYTFRVKARNINGIESTQSANFTFKVKPAFWQTWWFRLLMIGSLVFLTAYFYRRRVNQIREREKEKTNIFKKMAELDEKLLRSQMNPHFIFNSLNSIQKYIWESKEEDAAEYLANFAKLMRGILENSRMEFVTLEEEIKIMKLYVDLEHRRCNGKFDYNLIIDADLDIKKVKILPLIVQPFIENAIWHGLSKKVTKGLLSINIGQNGNALEIVVEDNGVGRQTDEIRNSSENKSLGQSITSQRLQKLMDATQKNANVTIIDLLDNQQKPKGTKVIVRLPIID